jgi:site-specific recombinase XerD
VRACSKRAPTGIRNAALLALLWRCGLRLGEALDLEPRDIDLSAQTLHVRHGKGDKSRRLALDVQTAALLARWLDRRSALGHNGRRKLLCTLDGKPLQQSYVRTMFKRLAARAGIDSRTAHPHALRHAFAAGLAREGVPMNVIRDALGHSSLAVTDRYLRDVAPVHVEATMRAREWAL